METWAHGQDIVDAVGAHREPSARLRHVAHIGVRARPFSYRINSVDVPDQDVHVLLDAPGGGAWEWAAPADRAEPATDAVRGDAEEFCLVVTQRRNLADTDLQLTGAVAAQSPRRSPVPLAAGGSPVSSARLASMCSRSGDAEGGYRSSMSLNSSAASNPKGVPRSASRRRMRARNSSS
jgi:hypothetical protein